MVPLKLISSNWQEWYAIHYSVFILPRGWCWTFMVFPETGCTHPRGCLDMCFGKYLYLLTPKAGEIGSVVNLLVLIGT